MHRSREKSLVSGGQSAVEMVLCVHLWPQQSRQFGLQFLPTPCLAAVRVVGNFISERSPTEAHLTPLLPPPFPVSHIIQITLIPLTQR